MNTQQKQFHIFAWMTVAFIVIALLIASGCESPEKYDPIIEQQQQKQRIDEAARVRLVAELADLEDAKNKLAIELDKARREAADTKAIEARIVQVESDAKVKAATVEKLTAEQVMRGLIIAELEKQKAAAGDVPRQIGEGAQTVGRFLPTPWGELLGTVGIIIAGLSESKRRQTKNAAMEAIGTFSTGIASGLIPLSAEAASRLKAAQSDAANKLVKEAQYTYRDAMILAEPTTKP